MKALTNPSIYQVTARILHLIAHDLETSSTRAHLASLRQSINKDVHQATGVFPVIFAEIPENYLGEYGELTDAERAIVLTLQLFALHQQGKLQNINEQADAKAKSRYRDLGASLSSLRRLADDSNAIDRRFNAMITATSFTELANHLRHMIKLLKSKTDTKINYPQLAQDLFWFQKGQASSIRLQWSRSYYRYYDSKEEEK